jgi:hypothetical protein
MKIAYISSKKMIDLGQFFSYRNGNGSNSNAMMQMQMHIYSWHLGICDLPILVTVVNRQMMAICRKNSINFTFFTCVICQIRIMNKFQMAENPFCCQWHNVILCADPFLSRFRILISSDLFYTNSTQLGQSLDIIWNGHISKFFEFEHNVDAL